MSKTIYNAIVEIEDMDNLEDAKAAAAEIAGRVDAMDDRIRELVKIADDYKENFDEKSIVDLRDYCGNIANEFENMKKELY
jgi:hypothetical protein